MFAATVCTLLDRDALVGNGYSIALLFLNIYVSRVDGGAVTRYNQFGRAFPVQSETVASGGEDDSVTVVCMSELRWREQMISYEHKIREAP